jgi:glycosyltransferase involved in cell wall biosynthesis
MVHACGCTAGDDLAWAIAKLGQKAPAWVMSVHGNLPDYVTGNRCLREAGEIMTFDQSALDRLNKIENMRPDVSLMPRPVEKRELEVGPTAPPHLVMVSRLSKTKGPAALAAIEAVEALENRFPGLSLTIFGEGSARDAILARAQALNAKRGREAVKAPGRVTDPFAAIAGAAAVIGTSYVALEALFHAIPVVAAGYEGYGVVDEKNLGEAVDCNFGDGFPGVQPKVTAEWLLPCFEGVLTHFSDDAGRAELERMRIRLEAEHSLDAVAARLESIYQKAIEAKKAGVKR